MKKRVLFILSIAVFGLAMAAQAKTITLTYSSFFPPTHDQSKLAEAWCKEVEAKQGARSRSPSTPEEL